VYLGICLVLMYTYNYVAYLALEMYDETPVKQDVTKFYECHEVYFCLRY
jgi:hypothetical protein